MNAIGPGDWVAFSGHPLATDFETSWSPPRGGLRRCTGTLRAPLSWRCGVCGGWEMITVDGHPNTDFCINLWRPIYRPRADLIANLLAPTPAAPAHIPVREKEIA